MFKKIVLLSVVLLSSAVQTGFASEYVPLKIDNLTLSGDTRESVASVIVGDVRLSICSTGPGQPPCPHARIIYIPTDKKIVFKVLKFYFYDTFLTVDSKTCSQTFMVKPGENKVINILPEVFLDRSSIIRCSQ